MTTRREFRPGDVVRYPYLWKRQRDQGETEGRKSRPVCVLVAVTSAQDDLTHLMLLAISGQAPTAHNHAIAIPEIERRRGGLSDWREAWITISEYNYDIAERSYYFDARPEPLGRFSKPFMMQLAREFAPFFTAKQGRVDRIE